VRAIGTVYWEAQYTESVSSGSNLIKSVAGEDWIIERLTDVKPCFYPVLHTLFPFSARISISAAIAVVSRRGIDMSLHTCPNEETIYNW
jgi:hypothetical protein